MIDSPTHSHHSNSHHHIELQTVVSTTSKTADKKVTTSLLPAVSVQKKSAVSNNSKPVVKSLVTVVEINGGHVISDHVSNDLLNEDCEEECSCSCQGTVSSAEDSFDEGSETLLNSSTKLAEKTTIATQTSLNGSTK